MRKTWLITGCSEGGIGAGIAKAVLARGYNAVVTARSTDKVRAIVEKYPDSALAVALDVITAVRENNRQLRKTMQEAGVDAPFLGLAALH